MKQLRIPNSIAAKMMASFLLVALIAAFVPVLVLSLTVRSGLFDLLDSADLFQSNAHIANLERQYAQNNNWDFLFQAEAPYLPAFEPEQTEAESYLLKRMIRPPVADLQGPWWLGLVPNIAVFDTQGNLLIGNRDLQATAELQPLADSSGQVVGYFAHSAAYSLEDDSSSYGAAIRGLILLMLVITVMVTLAVWLLARHFRKPINELNNAAQHLADGDLKTRIPEDTSGGRAELDELQELAHNFNCMAQALEANEKSRRKWVADTSHELRTPLTVALGTVCAMRDGLLPLAPEALDKLETSLQDMNTLVEDLAFLAKADAGKLELRLEPVALQNCLAEARTLFDANALNAELDLQIDDSQISPIHILADKTRLRQILRNLILNSLTYTDQPGTIRLSARENASQALLIFEDSQPCPTPDQLPRLFERFYRCNPARQSGGSGLGLAICRELVLAMQGTIEAQASDLGGLQIVISLPQVRP